MLLFRVRVSGLSCWPYLVPGKTYWAVSLLRPREGDFVIVPGTAIGGSIAPYVIKRVCRQNADTLVLKSTLPWHTIEYTVWRTDILGVLLRPRRVTFEGAGHRFLQTCDTVQP